MERKFHVVFTGKLHAGFKHVDTIAKMVSLFQVDPQKVTKMVYSGRPSIVKHGVSGEEAKKYRDHLERAGLQIKIIEAEETEPAPQPSPVAPVADQTVDEVETAAPQVPAEKTSARKTQPEDQPAPADIEEQPVRPLFPSKVANSHGWTWIRLALRLFFSQQVRWQIMIVFWLCLSLVPLSVNSLFGVLAGVILFPIFLGGLMSGAQSQQVSDQLRLGHLFHGFGRRFPRFLAIGFSSLLPLTAQGLAIMLLLGKPFAPGIHTPLIESLGSLPQNVPFLLAVLLLVLVLSAPLLMCFYFAPCLAGIDDQTTFSSFRLSFTAIRINLGAFSVYAPACMLLVFIYIFLCGALNALCLLFLGNDRLLSFLLPMLCMVILGIPFFAVILLSIYTAYRDIFHCEEM